MLPQWIDISEEVEEEMTQFFLEWGRTHGDPATQVAASEAAGGDDTGDDTPPHRAQYSFQITSVPESEAPLEHREALVGKVFPMMPRNMDGHEPMAALEVESRLPVEIADAVGVEMRHVVQVLRAAGEELAADYWAARDFASLVFQRSEVRVFLPPQAHSKRAASKRAAEA